MDIFIEKTSILSQGVMNVCFNLWELKNKKILFNNLVMY